MQEENKRLIPHSRAAMSFKETKQDAYACMDVLISVQENLLFSKDFP